MFILLTAAVWLGRRISDGPWSWGKKQAASTQMLRHYI